MNKKEAEMLEANGFLITRVPNLEPQPKRVYYSRDGLTGEVVKHNLPADAYSLGHYLKRGLVLNLDDLSPQAEGSSPAQPAVIKKTKRIARRGRSQKRFSVGGK